MPQKRVRLKDVAAEAGLSVQAVSMALRGHKRIAKATRQRVAGIAARMGYQADPALSALSRYRTDSSRSGRKWETVGLVSDWSQAEWFRGIPSFERLNTALHAEARERGITLESCWLGHYGRNGTAAFRRIYNKGIRGIIVCPPAQGDKPRPVIIPRKDFHIVTFGPEHIYPDYHVVQFDFYENLRLAWAKLWQRGCRRIGLVLKPDFGWRTGEAWLAAWMAEMHIAGISQQDLPPCFVDTSPQKTVQDWINAYCPDAIITILREVKDWIQSNTGRVPVALLTALAPGECGINIDPEKAARAAFELLLLEMQRALVSETQFNLRIHIPGRWVD